MSASLTRFSLYAFKASNLRRSVDSKVCCLTNHLPIEHSALLKRTEQLWFKELANCNILRETLPPSCLEHEIARQLLCSCGLERSGCDIFVERVAGDNGPAVEDEREGDLSLCVDLHGVRICYIMSIEGVYIP